MVPWPRFSGYCPLELLTFTVLLFTLAHVQAQRSCEVFQGQPPLCSQIYSSTDQIYLGPEVIASTQSEIAALAQSQASQISLLPAVAPECFAVLSRFVCTSYFQNCSSVIANGTTAVIGRAPCRSECLEVNQICATVFQQFGQSPTDCFAVNQSTGLALFPDGWQEYDLGGSTKANVTCNAKPSAVNVTCRGPLVPIRNGSAVTSCALKCPSIPASPKEWKILWGIVQVTGWLGLLMCFSVVIPFVCLKQRRKFPSNIPIFLLLAMGFISISYVLRSFGGNRILCANSHSLAKQSHFACVISAFFALVGCIGATVWCTVATLHAVLTLYMSAEQMRKLLRGLEIVYHLYCWGIPLLFFIVGLATNRIGARYGYVFCFLVDRSVPPRASDSLWWSGSIYVNEAFHLAVTVILMVLLFRKFILILPKFSVMGLYAVMKSQIRMISFVFIFSYTVAIVVTFGWLSFSKDSDYTKSALEWISCWSTGGSNCRGKPRDSFPYGLNVLNTLNLGLASIWGVLILGTVPETILWWRVLFHLLLERDTKYFAGLFDRDSSLSLLSLSTHSKGSGSPVTPGSIRGTTSAESGVPMSTISSELHP